MAALTAYLQRAFSDVCPAGWTCRSEADILSGELNRLLGYTSRADLVLTRTNDGRRLWIEFEISRADPVANHAKFATAHLFRPWTPQDAFVSMISPHVARGRRNLAANTIALMRHIGIQAFQTPLLPFLNGADIKRLNHLSADDLQSETLDVRKELERVFAVSEPVAAGHDHRIHFAGNLTEVMLNVHQWHEDMKNPALREHWGKRTITYFVHDPRTARFAPSKYCAFLTSDTRSFLRHMTIDRYVTYDESEPRFDGHVAKLHLEQHLAMRPETPETAPAIARQFDRWLDGVQNAIGLHPRAPVFLTPPDWFV